VIAPEYLRDSSVGQLLHSELPLRTNRQSAGILFKKCGTGLASAIRNLLCRQFRIGRASGTRRMKITSVLRRSARRRSDVILDDRFVLQFLVLLIVAWWGRLQAMKHPVHDDAPSNGNRQAGDYQQQLRDEWGHCAKCEPGPASEIESNEPEGHIRDQGTTTSTA
jgi:hypothetical protein